MSRLAVQPWEARLILAAATLHAVLVVVVLTVTSEREVIWRGLPIGCFAVAAVGSGWCCLRPSRRALGVSLVGKCCGFAERAVAVPWNIAVGYYPLDGWRSVAAAGTYIWLAVLVSFVWLRVLQPVIELQAAANRGRDA